MILSDQTNPHAGMPSWQTSYRGREWKGRWCRRNIPGLSGADTVFGGRTRLIDAIRLSGGDFANKSSQKDTARLVFKHFVKVWARWTFFCLFVFMKSSEKWWKIQIWNVCLTRTPLKWSIHLPTWPIKMILVYYERGLLLNLFRV